MALPQAGEHIAKAIATSVYENANGTLVCAQKFETEAGERITSYLCLTSKDGAINEKTVHRLKEVFAWDGIDPFWLQDTDLTTIPVSITIEEEVGTDGVTRPTVRWINKPGGGGGKMPEQGDRQSILAKYGARFRAISGGTPPRTTAENHRAATYTPPQPASAPPAPPDPELPPSPKYDGIATMQEAWTAFCSEYIAGKGKESEMNQKWFQCLIALTGKKQPDCQPADWHRIKTECGAWICKNVIPF